MRFPPTPAKADIGGKAHSGPVTHKGGMPRPVMRLRAVYEVKWRSTQRRSHRRRSPPSVGGDANPRPAMHESEAAKLEYSGSSDRVRKKASTCVRAPKT